MKEVMFTPGHDLLSELLGGCMQGDGQGVLQLVAGKLHDAVGHADGGDGDVASPDAHVLDEEPVPVLPSVLGQISGQK